MKKINLSLGTLLALGVFTAFVAPTNSSYRNQKFDMALQSAIPDEQVPTQEPEYPVQDAGFVRSTNEDYSFEAKQSLHTDELQALTNYYANVTGRTDILESYAKLIGLLTAGAPEQENFMAANGISLNGFRVRKGVLQYYSKDEKIRYYENIQKIKSLYTPSADVYAECLNLLETVQQDASYSFAQDLFILEQYLRLAQKLNYTKLEILTDITGGYKSAKMIETNSGPEYNLYSDDTYVSALYRNDSQPQGLAAHEAVRKLQQLVEEKSQVELAVYPTPFISRTDVEILCGEVSSLEVSVYNAYSGEYIKTLLENQSASAFTDVTWDGTDSWGRTMPDGDYLIRVTLPEAGFTEAIRVVKQGGIQLEQY